MSSINEKGDIFVKSHRFIDEIRSTMLYNEQLLKFKSYLDTLVDKETWNDTQVLIYDFDDGEFQFGAQKKTIIENHSFVILAYGVINPQTDKVEINPKSYW